LHKHDFILSWAGVCFSRLGIWFDLAKINTLYDDGKKKTNKQTHAMFVLEILRSKNNIYINQGILNSTQRIG
jgi:hypothetical protein